MVGAVRRRSVPAGTRAYNPPLVARYGDGRGGPVGAVGCQTKFASASWIVTRQNEQMMWS
jgi:hypothetical protein